MQISQGHLGARHRAPVRSSHGYTTWRCGHKWVVLAVLVRFPWANRPWALPVLADLYRSEKDDQKRSRPLRRGPHRDEYFFSTDLAATAVTMIEAYAGRWNLETTFQEARYHLGLETTRGWCRWTVLRAAPGLFGLYTVVALLYQALPEEKRVGRAEWPGKAGVTFSDALTSVRRWLWREWVFHRPAEA